MAGKVVTDVSKQPVAFINTVSRAQLHIATPRRWVLPDASKERVSLTSKASREETTISDTATISHNTKILDYTAVQTSKLEEISNLYTMK